jgi:DNA-binding IclR family transcriptional regulator
MKRGETMLAEDLADELGMARAWAARHLRELWTLDLVYIAGWDREACMPVPVYRWGNRPDAKRPEARTRAEYMRRYRARLKERRCAGA